MRGSRVAVLWLLMIFWLEGSALSAVSELAAETESRQSSLKVAAKKKKKKKAKKSSSKQEDKDADEEESETPPSASPSGSPKAGANVGGYGVERKAVSEPATASPLPVQAGSKSDYGFGDTAAQPAAPSSLPAGEGGAGRAEPKAATLDKGESGGKGYPVAEIVRPLALPPMMKEVRGALRLGIGEGDTAFGLDAGFGMGVYEAIEAGLSLPLLFTPQARFGDLDMYGLYELSSLLGVAPLKLAGRLNLIIPLSKGYTRFPPHKFAVLADAPLKYALTEMFELIGDAGLGLALGGGASAFMLVLDAGVGTQILAPLYVDLRFGAHMFLGGPFKRTEIPFRTRVQYTLLDALDLYADLGFPDLKGSAKRFEVLLGADFRF